MVTGIEAVYIGSTNAKKLAEFYRDTVGLSLTQSYEMGGQGENGYAFTFKAGSGLYIMDHSAVKGKSPQPDRMMVNLEVDDIETLVKKLKEAKVKIVKDLYHIQDYGLVATFEDPDGNYFQLVKTRP